MIRTILALLIGLITGFLLIGLLEMVGHLIYPPPPGTNLTNPEIVKELIKNAPTGALILILISYAIGAFGGGLVAMIIGKKSPGLYIGGVGGGLLGGCLLNLFQFPHPIWFTILSILIFIPCTALGVETGKRMIKYNTTKA